MDQERLALLDSVKDFLRLNAEHHLQGHLAYHLAECYAHELERVFAVKDLNTKKANAA